MNEYNRTRAKILGVLIYDARLYAGRTVEDCARLLQVNPEQFLLAERGEHILSLPELEVLAMYLNVPLSHFWGEKAIGQQHRTHYHDFVTERHQKIGQMLRQAREKEGRRVQDLAAEINVPPSRIEAFEMGQQPISLFQLDRLARYLGHSLNFFIEADSGLLAEHEEVQKLRQRLDDLPPEMLQFVSEPINLSYLEIAMRLSRMDVKELRGVAENILNITF